MEENVHKRFLSEEELDEAVAWFNAKEKERRKSEFWKNVWYKPLKFIGLLIFLGGMLVGIPIILIILGFSETTCIILHCIICLIILFAVNRVDKFIKLRQRKNTLNN